MAAYKNNLYTSIPDWFATPGNKGTTTSSTTSSSSSGGGTSVYYSSSGSGSSIDILTTSSTTSPSDTNVFSALRTRKDFLRKDAQDETKYLLRLLGGLITNEIKSTNLTEGTFGTGYLLSSNRNNGKSYLEVDELFVRVKALFNELEIRKLSYTGGTIILGPAGATCKAVEELRDDSGTLTGWRCYINTVLESDHDGTTEKVDNEFRVNDQVQCRTFNVKEGTTTNASNKYYWRLCTAVGEDYIDLDAFDCDSAYSNDVPEVGDAMVTVGNRTEADRQAVIIQSTVETMSPTITLYAGIDDYSYADKNYISMGVDHQTWKGYLNVYGDTYIGDREHTSYMKYTPEEGLSVKGNISAASTLENSDGSQQTISDALNELSNQFNENLSAYDTALRKDIDILQNQVDGAIETWFYDDEPTLENLPAANWVDDDAKNIHLGDLYYSAQGYAYRFQLTDGVYNWVQILDNDIVKALTAAKQAQDTADGKRKSFYYPTKDSDAHPKDSDSYDVGDTWLCAYWVEGDQVVYNDDLLVCVTGKEAGQLFSIKHWTLASKYTDNSALEAFKEVYAENIKEIQSQVDGKAETWYQSTDPSKSWTTDEDKALHKGDLWYNSDSNSKDYGKTFYWTGTEWDYQSVPKEVFDTIDGKAAIYVNQPSSYNANDLWILNEGETCGNYSTGDLLVALISNTTFNEKDWTKKVKYTDDTLASRARELAQSAQSKLNNLASGLVNVYQITDAAIADGEVDADEIEAITAAMTYLAQLKTDADDAVDDVKTQTIVANQETTTSTDLAVAKATLIKALAALDDAYTALYGLLDKISTDKSVDSSTAATLRSYYKTFNTKYSDLSKAITYINNVIMDILNTKITSYAESISYLTKAITNETTEISGGLIQTAALILGYHDTGNNFVPMAGSNGMYENDTTIASWWGGNCKDKKTSKDSDAAKALIRMDGSGYLANNNIQWNADGDLTATFNGIVLGDVDMGPLFSAFKVITNGNSKYVEPTIPFTNIESTDYIIIGNAKIQWQTDDTSEDGSGYLRIYHKDETPSEASAAIHLLTTGDVVASATTSTTVGSGSGGAKALYDLVDTAITSATDGNVLIYNGTHWVNKPQSDIVPDLSDYATKDYVAGQGYITDISSKADKATTLQGYGITDGVNIVTVTGDGNAVTTATISNHTLTLTKGTKFLTSHQDISGKADKATTLSGYGITDAYTSLTVDSLLAKYLPLTGGTLTGTLTSKAIAPSSDNTYTLGTTSAKWSNVYATTFTGNLSGNATTATTATTASQVYKSLTGTNSADLILATMADNDGFRLRIGGTASDAGFVELATSDNASEPIYVRQYSGTFTTGTVKRTLALLDSSGNTSVPGNLTVGGTFVSTGLATLSSGVKVPSSKSIVIGDATISWDSDAGALKFDTPIYSTGDVTAGGTSDSSTSSDVGSNTLADLLDTTITSAVSGDVLVYDGTHWINKEQTDIVPDLTGYATETWVTNKKYLTASDVTGKVDTVATSGSGNAVTSASISGSTLTLKKESTFSLSGHTHGYVSTVKVGDTSYTASNNIVTLPAYPTSMAWSAITDKPSTYTPSSHTHTKSQITDFPTTWAWDSITGKPSTYSPSSHTHSYASSVTVGTTKYSVSDNNITIPAYPSSMAWSAITGKPSTYTPSSHTHAITDIASLKSLKVATAATNTGWTGNTTDDYILPTMSFMAFWNGAYNSSGTSNLAYCNKGAFGTIVTKSTSDYLASTTTYAGSSSVGGSATSAVKLDSSAGSTTLPVYFSGGKPVAINTTGVGISITGSSASCTGNADTATTLKNSRTIWGLSFNGSANVSGALSGATTGSFSSDVTVGGSLTVSGSATIKNSAYQVLTLLRSTTGNYGSAIRFKNADGKIADLGFAFGDDTDSYFAMDITGNDDVFKVTATGNVIAAGDVTATSDMRYKEVISDVIIDPAKISNAPLFVFKWKDKTDTATHIGTSAQYWKEVLPELVVGDDKLSLNYATLGTTIGIVNSKRIDELEKENRELKATLNKVINILNTLGYEL